MLSYLPEVICIALWVALFLCVRARRVRFVRTGKNLSLLYVLVALGVVAGYAAGGRLMVCAILSLPPVLALLLLAYTRVRWHAEREIRHLLERGDTEAAELLARRLIDRAGPTAGRYHLLGLSLVHRGQWSEAIVALEEAERLGGGPPVRADKAIALWKSGSAEAALPLLEEARKERPRDPIPALNLCQLYAELGRTVEARGLLHEAEALVRADPHAGEVIATALEEAQRACGKSPTA